MAFKMQPQQACFTCPQVPAISEELAHRFIQRLSEDEKWPALMLALAWLVERHEGLQLYEGITGRPYTVEEKDRIGAETGYVAAAICPYFVGPEECRVRRLCSDPPVEADRLRQRFFWLPTAVARSLAKEQFHTLVADGHVADAKVAILTRPSGWYTRETVDAQRLTNVVQARPYSVMYHI